MIQWIVINLFLAALAGIGAGAFFVLFSLVRAMHLSNGAERLVGLLAAIAAILVVFLSAKYIIRLAERMVNRAR